MRPGSPAAATGAGALNIDRSVKIAACRTGKPGASATRGWDIGTLTHTSFDSRNFATRSYAVTVPASTTSTLRVALSWNSRATVNGSTPETIFASNLSMDLDVRVFEVTANGSQVQAGSALSYDNSYEVADVRVRPGATYVIKVHRWRGAPAEWSWFGIAWDLR